MAFAFRLERALQLYRKRAEVEELRLSERVSLHAAARDRLRALLAERARADGEVLSSAVATGRDFAVLSSFRQLSRQKEFEAQAGIEELARAVDQQRRVVAAAQRKVRLVEKVRERRLAEHTAAVDRELESLVADAYLARWQPSS